LDLSAKIVGGLELSCVLNPLVNVLLKEEKLLQVNTVAREEGERRNMDNSSKKSKKLERSTAFWNDNLGIIIAKLITCRGSLEIVF
tara:strand:- start:103 stop:360 length:258 start_codon:yes stop_codon:yes gene_type:complete